MHNSRAFVSCMQAIVLLNLVFVQLTGAAGMQWLGPLYALTIAAPLLTRFHNKLAYRLLWNGAVICFFAILLSHALSRSLASVLEDGLILAVLCQVHILNNLRSSQRPDLLFYNAFLIAAITGFMTRELGFALAFLAFVPFFVIGQQLLSALGEGRRLSRHGTRLLVVDGCKRSAVLLVLCLLAFLFWPRDFNRKPMLRNTFDLVRGGGELQVGFNEKLELERKGDVSASDRLTLRVTLIEGTSADVPTLWRGATLGFTSGGAWRPSKPTARHPQGEFDERWRRTKNGLDRHTRSKDVTARVAVERFPQGTERLFLPLAANDLVMASEPARSVLQPRHDGTINCAADGQLRYELSLSAISDEELGGPVQTFLAQALRPYVELPRSRRIDLARKLAADLAQQAPTQLEQFELVERVREHLAWTYAYLPPGSDGAADSLEEFLVGKSGGHCEFFASALATMLRSLGIPCRVATGFRSTNWDGDGKVLTFGESNAHAWVEVFDPKGGWYAVDASPFQSEGQGQVSQWAQLSAFARNLWDAVTDFDADRRSAVVTWLRAFPARAWRVCARNPFKSLIAGLVPWLGVALLMLRRRARTSEAVRAYGRALRNSKLRPLIGETPRELLARAERLQLAPEKIEALRTATLAHESTRYAA